MAKGPANQGVTSLLGSSGSGSSGGYGVGGNPAYGATATMPSPALMPSTPQAPAQYDVGGGLKTTVKPTLDKTGLPTITPQMRAAAAAPIPGVGAGGGFNPTPQAQFLLAMGADPKLLLGKNYNAWASTPVTRGSLAGIMGGGGGGQRYGSRASRYQAGGHR
jgi:hypothetical protein